MKIISRVAVLSLVVIAFGCKGNDSRKVDDALNSDLSLASQANPAPSADSISAMERAKSASATATTASGAATRQAAVHHARSRSGDAGVAATPRAPATHVEKNTKRDAAIGAGAGAILGAVTSKNKVKGGIIGAVAGGVLGGVVGNNVDKKKVPNP